MQELVLFYPEGHQIHTRPDTPDTPERLFAIRTALQAAGLWDAYPRLGAETIPEDILHAIHNPHYLKELAEICAKSGWLDEDTYTNWIPLCRRCYW